MNWPDDVVERVAWAIVDSSTIDSSDAPTYPAYIENEDEVAKAALSAITLQDIAKLPEVKAWVSGGILITNEGE